MRVAVLGCGSIGLRHVTNLVQLGAEVIAHDPSAAAMASATGAGARCFESMATLWAARPVAVVVASPTNLHMDQAREAVAQGCHLFVEKPLSHSMDGVEDLLRAASDRTTMVGCNMRFHPGPQAIKRLLDEGAIGRPFAARLKTGSYLPGWRKGQDHRTSYSASTTWGGAVLDCIHEIDLALWFLGPARLAASLSLPATDIGVAAEGLAEILLRHDNQALSSVHLNFVQRDYRRTCEIIGTEGTIAWDFVDGTVVHFGPDGNVASKEPQDLTWALNDMYVDELRHFLDAVRAGRPTCNPLQGGAEALRIALLARSGGA